MPKTHYLNIQKLSALSDVLHVLHGAKVEFTVKVSVEELLKLSPDQLKAFLGGIAELASVQAKAELTEND